jgi:arginyl-tRNA synthetase
VEETVSLLTEKGWSYEKDGALWLNTTDLLKQKYLAEGKTQEQVDKLDLKDDVLRRANGFYTYFAADIAYHRNKFEKRGFDKVINVWGADHHGHVARLQAALDGLGLDGSHRLVIVLMQLVNLLQDGKPVRMSKRTGKAIALHDLLDEISVDAARYFFNSRTSTSPLDFDLGLAVREDSENPVYYVQYAHARICTLLSRVQGEGVSVPAAEEVDFDVLVKAEELALIKALSQYPEEIRLAARDYDPSRINRYLVALAGDFHRFYNECRILGEEEQVLKARVKLADAVRSVLENGLNLLGVSAPEKM